MVARACVLGLVLLSNGIGAPVGAAYAFPRRDSEEKLLARIERARKPVKKAKFEIRLGRLKLLQAFDAFDQGNVEQCYQLLRTYIDRMKSAWATLEASGRPAWKKPQGFKQLDIALRQDARFLEDFMHRIPYEVREPVEKVAKEAEELRSAVLKALFPPVPPTKKSSSFPMRAAEGEATA